jgi:hypothetical protein
MFQLGRMTLTTRRWPAWILAYSVLTKLSLLEVRLLRQSRLLLALVLLRELTV